MGVGPASAPQRLSRPAITWRVTATAGALAALLYGTIWGRDDHFPFGPLVQYAFYTDPNGAIDSVYLEADTTAGTRIHVRLTSEGVGIPRGEIEGQLGRIIADPSILQSIAVAQRNNHPEEPQFTKLYLMRDRIKLTDRVPADTPVTETIAEWVVTQ